MGFYERCCLPIQIKWACALKPITKQRVKVVPEAEGRVLDVGCGAGSNFQFFDPARVSEVIAVEPNPMLARWAERQASGTPGLPPVTVLQTGAESLPLDDDSIDTAVCTFVMCTIPDMAASLTEIRRVLQPGGRLLFAEHGRAPAEDAGVYKWQRRMEPLQKALAGGCHLTRQPVEMLTQGGFRVDRWEQAYMPRTPRFVGCMYWGAAAGA